MANTLRNDEAEFGQQAADLVRLGGPCLDESLAGPMDCQQGLLLLGLDCDESHVGAGNCLTDGLGVGRVPQPVGAALAQQYGRALLDMSESGWLPIVKDSAIDALETLVSCESVQTTGSAATAFCACHHVSATTATALSPTRTT